jgi:hypothetical protein
MASGFAVSPRNTKRKCSAATPRAAYFRKLANKYGPQDALSRMVREDGTEVTLKQLQQSYGKVRVD